VCWGCCNYALLLKGPVVRMACDRSVVINGFPWCNKRGCFLSPSCVLFEGLISVYESLTFWLFLICVFFLIYCVLLCYWLSVLDSHILIPSHESPMVRDWIVQAVNGVLKCGPQTVHLAWYPVGVAISQAQHKRRKKWLNNKITQTEEYHRGNETKKFFEGIQNFKQQ
jgi:hypothetical protein